MAINIYTVADHLQQEGWKLISDVYKNLDTELEMECPKGHKQIQTYRNWRKYMICEKCMAGKQGIIIRGKVPPKKEGIQRILALDAATKISGFSVYDNGVLVGFGTFKVDDRLSTDERINRVKKWLRSIIEDWEPTFIGLEMIQLQSFGHNNFQVELYRVLANLQGVLIDTIFEATLDYDTVYPSTWRKYCGIDATKREAQKKAAQDKVKLWYNQDCTQDEADAICIGKYFCGKLKQSHSSWGEKID